MRKITYDRALFYLHNKKCLKKKDKRRSDPWDFPL